MRVYNSENQTGFYKISLDQLEALSTSGAYAMVHEDFKVAYVGRGTSILGSLARRLKGRYSAGKQFLVVEFGEPEIAYIKLYERLEAQGYKLTSKKPTRYRLVEEAVGNPMPGQSGFLVLVWYRSTAGNKELGGVYKTVAEARNFITSYSIGQTSNAIMIDASALRQQYLDALDDLPINLLVRAT